MGCLGSDGVHTFFDGEGAVCRLGGRWEDDLVGWFDGAAAVNELRVDAAVLGGADGKTDVLVGLAVIGGVGVVVDENPVADGNAVFREHSRERRDGRCIWLRLSWLAVLGGVQGEHDARRAGVTGEVTADRLGVGEFCPGVPGKVDAEGGSNLALVQGDADQAFLGPEPEGMPDEAQEVCRVLDGERIHCPFPCLCPFFCGPF